MPSHHHDEHEHNEHEHQESGASMIDHNEQHNTNMWKGLVAMMGLVLFFVTEKALTMLAEWRKHRQRRNKVEEEGKECILHLKKSVKLTGRSKIVATYVCTSDERERCTKQQCCR